MWHELVRDQKVEVNGCQPLFMKPHRAFYVEEASAVSSNFVYEYGMGKIIEHLLKFNMFWMILYKNQWLEACYVLGYFRLALLHVVN
jgi:hypothetical protein